MVLFELMLETVRLVFFAQFLLVFRRNQEFQLNFLSQLERVELNIRKAVILFTHHDTAPKNGQRHHVHSPKNCHMKVCYTTN